MKKANFVFLMVLGFTMNAVASYELTCVQDRRPADGALTTLHLVSNKDGLYDVTVQKEWNSFGMIVSKTIENEKNMNCRFDVLTFESYPAQYELESAECALANTKIEMKSFSDFIFAQITKVENGLVSVTPVEEAGLRCHVQHP